MDYAIDYDSKASNQDLILMLKDTPVLRVNFDEGKYIFLNKSKAPFLLQEEIRDTDVVNDRERRIIERRNADAVLSFLARRVLPITRSHAKKIYELFGASQMQDEVTKAKIAITCRAVSLQDNYWVKLDNEEISWNDVDLRTNHLNEIVTQIALHGSSLSLTGTFHSPEFTTHGVYTKAWMREQDDLYLYKLGSPVEGPEGDPIPGSWESKVEVTVSNILDKCNVNHLKYEPATVHSSTLKEDFYACKCKCMTTEDVSIFSGSDFTAWCRVRGADPLKEALKIDADTIYKMWIVDYLVSNRDRHDMNWGFFYDCNNMKILGCHPLYDHNNSFDRETMLDKDRPYLYDSTKTMRQSALYAMKKVDFHFTEDITRSDFLTDRQYNSFMDRAKELGIKVKKEVKRTEASDFHPLLQNKKEFVQNTEFTLQGNTIEVSNPSGTICIDFDKKEEIFKPLLDKNGQQLPINTDLKEDMETVRTKLADYCKEKDITPFRYLDLKKITASENKSQG